MFNFKTSSLRKSINSQIEQRIKNKEAGVTNTQVAIVVLVGVILLLGALGGYQYIVQAKVNNEISTLTDLRAATVRYGQFAGTFTEANVTTATLAGMNFFASSGLTVGGAAAANGAAAAITVTNQWGGTVIPAVGTSAILGDSIAFSFTGVSTVACRELGTKVDNIASGVTINGVVTKATGAATLPATVVTNCAAGDNNTMVYTLAR